jgi:hypothetical protein
MKSYSLFGVLGFGLAALAAACTVNSTTINNGGNDGGDDSTTSASGSGGSSSGSSTDGSSEGSTTSSSSSSSGGGDSGGDAEACTGAPTILAADGGPSDCDACMKAHCCTQLLACDNPDGGVVDDAGTTICEDKLACVVGLVTVDSGSINENLATCFDGDASAAPATLTGLLSCASTNCATQCQ